MKVKSVVIKGGRKIAEKSAKDFGIELLYLHEISIFGEILTVGYTTATVIDLNLWLRESSHEAGSLMCWDWI